MTFNLERKACEQDNIILYKPGLSVQGPDVPEVFYLSLLGILTSQVQPPQCRALMYLKCSILVCSGY